MTRALKTTTAILFTLILGALLTSCGDDDCPVCPPGEPVVKPYKGWLYYVDGIGNYDVYVIDMETDSIVDSIDVPDDAFGGLDVSSDGRYMVVASDRFDPGNPFVSNLRCHLYDAQTLEYIREWPDTVVPYFDLRNNRVVGTRQGRVVIYDYPSLTKVRDEIVDSIGFDALNSAQNRLYGGGLTETEYRYRFFSYDLGTRVLREVPIRTQAGYKVQVFALCFNRDGSTMYFKGLADTPPYGEAFVGAYDLREDRMIWKFMTLGHIGGVALSPDEKEVWMTDPGFDPDSPNPGTVYILNAATGAYLHGISLWGYPSNPFRPLTGNTMIFSPSGEKAYLGSGGISFAIAGSVIPIDTRSREIIKIISPDLKRHVLDMSIGPKL